MLEPCKGVYDQACNGVCTVMCAMVFMRKHGMTCMVRSVLIGMGKKTEPLACHMRQRMRLM